MADPRALRLTESPLGVRRAALRQFTVSLSANVRELSVAAIVILIASAQVTARSEDPNGTALAGTLNVINGTGGDLSQYRPLSAYLSISLQHLFDLGLPPFQAMRFVQCLLIFGLAYAFYDQLGLNSRARLFGIGVLAGLVSLELGGLGPSSFSLDRFADTIFYLLAGLLVLRGRETWIPALIAVAIANRESAVFMPALILAKHSIDWRHLTERRVRTPLVTAVAAWAIAAVVYLAIHLHFGPHPRTEQSYFGPDMFVHSLGMPAQTAYFVAAINVLPVLAIVLLKDADPFLRRMFWMVVPLWFAIHIWAARLGEGIMYLAPTALIIVPLVLQGLQRRLDRPVSPSAGSPVPAPPA